LLEDELTSSGLAGVDLGTGNVARQQIGRELNARKMALEILRQCLDRARLRESGQALHEQVAIGKQGDEQLLDDGFLPDDGGADALLKIEDLIATGHHPF
jgi:hypothetical protein